MSATIETLEEFRSDASWSHLFLYVQHVAELNDVAVTEYQQKRQRRFLSRFEEGIVLESVGSRENISTGDGYKVRNDLTLKMVKL